jgi:hypothetical protein
MPLSLQLGYEAGMLPTQTIISIVKLKEPTELLSERDGTHDLFFGTFLAAINASACGFVHNCHVGCINSYISVPLDTV